MTSHYNCSKLEKKIVYLWLCICYKEHKDSKYFQSNLSVHGAEHYQERKEKKKL